MAHPHNLPILLTPLIGRDEDVAAIQLLLTHKESRLVTLTGAPGSGKSRLALAVAANLVDDFPDGVWFVDLALLTDPELVLPTIARTLRLREIGTHPIRDALAESLAGKRVLIVLDNYEHLMEAASVVAELLAASPGTAVLVTSRQPLRLRSEHKVRVNPLAQSPAFALFVDRARATMGRFVLTDEDAHAVAEICRRLDGLPLAIELAAANARLMSPTALLKGLDRRLPLLAEGPRDAPARHHTMWDAITWSYDLLPTQEQRLFSYLSVFAGGFTPSAAVAVTAESAGERGEQLREHINNLVDASLVQYVGAGVEEPRYRMLETIREYGIGRLARRSEFQSVHEAHASYFTTLANESFTGARGAGRRAAFGQELGLTRLAEERPNLMAAHDWLEQSGFGQSATRLKHILRWTHDHLPRMREDLDFPSLGNPLQPPPQEIENIADQIKELLTGGQAQAVQSAPELDRYTRIAFPEECQVQQPVKLLIQLTLAPPARTRVASRLRIAREEIINIDIHVTASGFVIDRTHQRMSIPDAADSEEVVFELIPVAVGDQMIEVEFIQRGSRIGYALVTTSVKVTEKQVAA